MRSRYSSHLSRTPISLSHSKTSRSISLWLEIGTALTKSSPNSLRKLAATTFSSMRSSSSNLTYKIQAARNKHHRHPSSTVERSLAQSLADFFGVVAELLVVWDSVSQDPVLGYDRNPNLSIFALIWVTERILSIEISWKNHRRDLHRKLSPLKKREL